MKKFFTLAAACLFGAAAFAQEGENEYIVVDTVLTYDFVTAGAPLPLANLNCSWAFYSYENAEKLDSRRQDYKGYEADANSKAVGLPDECHVWVRNPRLVQNLTANGLYFGQARNFVVDGLVAGSKVVVEYTTTSEVEGEQALRYDNSEGSKTQCSIDGTVLEAGVSTYASGATITVDTTGYDNGKTGLDGYVSFFVFKETSISKVTITNPDETTFVYDLKKAGSTLEFSNLNRNQGNSGYIYVYESEESPNKNRNDFKGYTADEKSQLVGLPDECHVFGRQDRIVQNWSQKGIQVKRDTQWAIDGLDNDDQVQIFYNAEVIEDTEKQQIKYATGAEAATVAYLGESTEALQGNTIAIPSGEIINVKEAAGTDGEGNALEGNGYIVFQVYKEMFIEKVVITKITDNTPLVGIEQIATEEADTRAFNIYGQRTNNAQGLIIRNGKLQYIK